MEMITKEYISLHTLINDYNYSPQIDELFLLGKTMVRITGFKKEISGTSSEHIDGKWVDHPPTYSNNPTYTTIDGRYSGKCSTNLLRKHVVIKKTIEIINF